MGDRAHIIITSKGWPSDLVLYGHWAGDRNVETVKRVLEMPQARIGDADYLAAQLFHRFSTDGDYDGNLGYGIWPQAKGALCSDLDRNVDTVIVNADDGTWRTE